MSLKEGKLNILVTGGAGFIGSHLVDKLLQEGCHVIALDNLSNGSTRNLPRDQPGQEFNFIEGDILDTVLVESVMKEVQVVFHLACLGVRHSIHSPFENHKVNAEGTLVLLEAAKKAGIQHFFYVSTSEVYGRTTSFPISEISITNPLTVYGASKLAGEHYSNAFFECYGFPVTVLRIFNNYGPRAHYEGDAGEIIPRSIVRILYNQQPVLFGDGSITRDFFFVKDTAAVLYKYLELTLGNKRSEITGQTFNIGTGTEVSMKELIQRILSEMGKEELGIQYLDQRPADVPRLWVNADKFRKVTGFLPSYGFSEGLKETISYYRELMKEKDMIEEILIENWKKNN